MTTPAIGSYTAGMLVVHPRRPEWGPGKVLSVKGPHVVVYFRDVPGTTMGAALKTIDVGVIGLPRARKQSDPWLDNLVLDPHSSSQASRRRVPLPEALRRFAEMFPIGFEDPAYLEEERAYKWRAHEHFETELGHGELERLLEEGDARELARRGMAVVGKVNLLSSFKSAAMHDGLADPDASLRFFAALLGVLDEDTPSRPAFEALASAVKSLPSEPGKSSPDKWTVLTILPYLARPETLPFLKPEATKTAAQVLSFELMYEARPNWRTYRRLLELGEVLRHALEDHGLHPRDWIDLQSFMWLTAEAQPA